MKRLLLTFLLFSISYLLLAHEFWLHPDKFIYSWGELINVRMLVGENYEGENWNGNSSNINSLKLHLSDATDDLSGHISDSTNGDSLQFAIYDEGTYLLTYNSVNKFIELQPQKFLEYLKEDGLQETIDYRSANSENDSMGRELYQRSVKTIIQVGEKTTHLYKKETGLPLDIIPLQNPYTFKSIDSVSEITVKVLFHQKPLTNQLIKVWQRTNGQTTRQEFISDSTGVIRFPLKPNGRWMVSTVKMVRLTADPKAQWQSYWGSCTWGYE